MVQARVNLISLYARTGDLERAASQYEIVVASKTQLAEAHRAYGLALLSASQDSQALMVLDLAAAANPLDAAVHHARGLALERMRRLAEAAEAYRRAVESDPKTRGFRFALARVLVNLGRTDDALRELAPAHLPDDAEGARYMFMSATLVLRTGNVAEGRRLAQQALERARKHGVSDLAAPASPPSSRCRYCPWWRRCPCRPFRRRHRTSKMSRSWQGSGSPTPTVLGGGSGTRS
jgi:tetratricopeptide (TPR) repeat protein